MNKNFYCTVCKTEEHCVHYIDPSSLQSKEEFLPLFDNILLQPETEDYLLKQNDPTYTENGIVLAVGPDCKVVKVGDKIATFVFGMKHATRNGKTYHTIRELPAFIQGKYE